MEQTYYFSYFDLKYLEVKIIDIYGYNIAFEMLVVRLSHIESHN